MIRRICRCTRPLILAASLALCLAGCQQGRSMLGLNTSKVAAARHAPILGKQEWSEGVTKEQQADVQMAVARSLERQGQTDQAIKAYREVVSGDNRRADAYHRLAVLHDKKGDHQAAEKYYQAALQRNPKNAELWNDYGYSCYLRQRWEEAEKNLRRAIELSPDLARAHNNLGLLLARSGRQDEALQAFAKAGCSEAEARANLGFALGLKDDWPEAQRQFELAWKLDPQSRTARRGLEALQARSPKLPSPPVAALREERPAAALSQTVFNGPPPQFSAVPAGNEQQRPVPLPPTAPASPQLPSPAAAALSDNRPSPFIPPMVPPTPALPSPPAAPLSENKPAQAVPPTIPAGPPSQFSSGGAVQEERRPVPLPPTASVSPRVPSPAGAALSENRPTPALPPTVPSSPPPQLSPWNAGYGAKWPEQYRLMTRTSPKVASPPGAALSENSPTRVLPQTVLSGPRPLYSSGAAGSEVKRPESLGQTARSSPKLPPPPETAISETKPTPPVPQTVLSGPRPLYSSGAAGSEVKRPESLGQTARPGPKPAPPAEPAIAETKSTLALPPTIFSGPRPLFSSVPAGSSSAPAVGEAKRLAPPPQTARSSPKLPPPPEAASGETKLTFALPQTVPGGPRPLFSSVAAGSSSAPSVSEAKRPESLPQVAHTSLRLAPPPSIPLKEGYLSEALPPTVRIRTSVRSSARAVASEGEPSDAPPAVDISVVRFIEPESTKRPSREATAN